MSRTTKLCTLIACSLLASMSLVTTASAGGAGDGDGDGDQGRTHVVHPGDSIQAAIDSAKPGDTVLVTAGTYHEGVLIQTNRLTLRAKGHVRLKPSAGAPGPCDFQGETIGICVLPADVNFDTGAYTHRVRDVKIKGFRVSGFVDGVFGFGTRDFRVSDVRAANNAGYGIARFDGVGGSITDSATSGSGEAGIYVGDSPHADAVVKDNRTWNNGFGIFVRHTHDVTVRDNRVRRNCIGIFLLDDGQPEGSGDNSVVDNSVRRDNKFCPASDEGPAISGGGIVLFGSVRNRIVDNSVTNHHKPGTVASGGIVLLEGSSHNLVRENRLHHNKPADIVQDAKSVGNKFVDNTCRTSQPAWICAGHD
ncbi:MAG: right-handed parallel beta-helix repeat-containing protein [Propionibacteriales bacterium]|nr:right-handed parallel beta-helix repeat-containing protein [Propionibacteriales bacterium]